LNNLIDRYNAGSMDVERFFEELTAFIRSMDEEEKRHVKEGLTEEELRLLTSLYQRQ
jgi:type I restriction enzyme R subunit